MTRPLVQMERIDKKFPGVHALKEVDFDLLKGEVHALVGPNGSGKSTLMNILGGVLRSDSGKIYLEGEEVKITNSFQAQKQGISFIHQEIKLVPHLTVSENIFLGRFPTGYLNLLDWKVLHGAASKVLEMLEPNFSHKQLVSELSVAQQQLVEIAKSLSFEPTVLIMDEPTASLQQDEVDNLFKIIREIKNSGVGIIFISHRLGEVMEISDRVTVLRDGKKIVTEQTENLTKGKIAELMVGKSEGIFTHKKEKRTIGPKIVEVSKLSLSNKVSDISFSLHEGEILGFAGLVGSGRTEVLKCLFGAINPKSGTIKLKGKQYSPSTPVQAVASGLSLLPEDRKSEGLVLGMSIRENMSLASLKRFVKHLLILPKNEKPVLAALAKSQGLKYHTLEQVARSLSGGNQQKLVIAKWLSADSQVILMDEPSRGIDVGSKQEIFSLIESLAAKGKAIIFVSSELEEVVNVSDRIVVFFQGKTVKELKAKDTNIQEVMKYAAGAEEA